MKNDLAQFGKAATGLSRSPLGIIALFIVLVYGFASIVVALPNGLDASDRAPLIYFLVIFPCVVFFGFLWLVSSHPDKIYSPSDFKDENNFLKMKEELSELERRGETEYAVQIVEIKSDLEFLRKKIINGAEKTSTKKQVISTKTIQREIEWFMEAVEEYKINRATADGWRKRVEVDKRVKSGAILPSIDTIGELLEKNKGDQEIEMAAAVSLGVQRYNEDGMRVAKILSQLLCSRWERARYRAAQSAGRIGGRADTSTDVRKFLLDEIELALSSESAEVVRDELDKVRDDLSSAMYKFS